MFATQESTDVRRPKVNKKNSWAPPDNGWLTINSDASFVS